MSIEALTAKAEQGKLFQAPSAPICYVFANGVRRHYPEGIVWAETPEELLELEDAARVRNIRSYAGPQKEAKLQIPEKPDFVKQVQKS